MNKDLIYFKKWLSPIGDLFLYANETHLIALLFADDAPDFLRYFKNSQIVEKSNSVIALAQQQLTDYFNQKRKTFDLPLQAEGTAFQKKAWAELSRIPYGQTVTYAIQAKNIQAEKAFRAVGSANGKNPIAIIIPCHRVIGSNGKIAGYAGGVSMKEKLLELEGIKI